MQSREAIGKGKTNTLPCSRMLEGDRVPPEIHHFLCSTKVFPFQPHPSKGFQHSGPLLDILENYYMHRLSLDHSKPQSTSSWQLSYITYSVEEDQVPLSPWCLYWGVSAEHAAIGRCWTTTVLAHVEEKSLLLGTWCPTTK